MVGLLGTRAAAAAALVASLLVLVPGGTAVGQDDNKRDDQQRDTKSRHETPSMNSISLRTGSGTLSVRAVILIQARIVEVSKTENFGVEFENLDRMDVSGVPLLSSLFNRPLQAGDLTADNRVGTAFRAGDGGIAAVINRGVKLDGAQVSVVNGKGRYVLSDRPKIIDVAATDLGELGTLPSVKTVLAGDASLNTTIVLGGLTASDVPEADAGAPVLSDVPVLQRLFLGTVHQRENKELIVFVRPSIIAGDE